MGEWYAKQRVGDLPAKAAARWPDRLALVDGARRYSWTEFAAGVDRVARGLIALGVKPGEHVAVWMTNCAEFLFATYAVARVGAVFVPLNTRYRDADAAFALGQSDSVVLLGMDRSGPVDYAAMIATMMPGGRPVSDLPRLRRVAMLGDPVEGAITWQAMLDAGEAIADDHLAARAAAVDPDRPWIIVYTSGTTGSPKGALHGHICIRNVAERCLVLGHVFTDVHMSYLPLFHLYGLSEVALAACVSGAAQVLQDTFDAEAALRLIAAEKATVIHGFDTHFADLMAAKARTGADTSSLRLGTFPSGGDNAVPVARRAQTELCPTVSGFGMTETWAFITISRLRDSEEQRCGASGLPLADIDVEVVDPETGETCPPEVPGEIRVTSYMNTMGYYNRPDATAATFDERGRLKTGDTALVRADGHLRFLGRYKDMLKVGGENVSPAEVEAWIMRLEGVDQVAVVGMPDPRLAEVAAAFIVRTPGSTLTAADVDAHCRGRIASFKIPRRVDFVDSLPMTPSGKVQKFVLRQLLVES
ncbi:MAG: AMP-binding protein [Pseudomonadota bacterium]|nr:AMP-binding protein [Pseudomonadota bacterium]